MCGGVRNNIGRAYGFVESADGVVVYTQRCGRGEVHTSDRHAMFPGEGDVVLASFDVGVGIICTASVLYDIVSCKFCGLDAPMATLFPSFNNASAVLMHFCFVFSVSWLTRSTPNGSSTRQ